MNAQSCYKFQPPPLPCAAPPVEPYIPIEESGLPEDLFSCQAGKTPWRSLLAHAIALERPLLAACYGKTCFRFLVSMTLFQIVW